MPMRNWMNQKLGVVLSIAYGILLAGWAASVFANGGSFWAAGLFWIGSVTFWSVYFCRALVPCLRVVDEKYARASGFSTKSKLRGADAALFVVTIWLTCLSGTLSAKLGGMTFASGICRYSTSFSWAHALAGVGLVLPFFAASAVFRAWRALPHRHECAEFPRKNIDDCVCK